MSCFLIEILQLLRISYFQVTTSIYNLILGKVYCDHHGMMHIRGNREYSCKLKFKEQSILERNPHQVNEEVYFVEYVNSIFCKVDLI